MNNPKGHGWVTPNAKGIKARCGGPKICKDCQIEAGILSAKKRQKDHDEQWAKKRQEEDPTLWSRDTCSSDTTDFSWPDNSDTFSSPSSDSGSDYSGGGGDFSGGGASGSWD
mgnify:CR=1 FL=1